MEEIRRKSAYLKQLELLITFMEKHNNFAKGKLRSKEELVIASRLWEECAGLLNSEGVTRMPEEWSMFWNDYKCRVRAKQATINRDHRASRGRPILAQQLTPLEERVAALLGRDAAGAANTSAVHTSAAPDLSTTVTVETPPIMTEDEQSDPVYVERVNQTTDEGTNLPQTVRPRIQRLRRIWRRARPRRQNNTAVLEEAMAFMARIERMLTRAEEAAAATSQRKLEALTSTANSLTSIATSLTTIVTSLTSIATSFDVIATSLQTYLSGLQN